MGNLKTIKAMIQKIMSKIKIKAKVKVRKNLISKIYIDINQRIISKMMKKDIKILNI